MTKNIHKITDFLKTGIFAGIEMKDSIDKVRSVLGKEDGPIALSKPSYGIHYGYWEFVFDEVGLTYIQNDHFDPKVIQEMHIETNSIVVEWNMKGIVREDIENELTIHGISFKEEEFFGRLVLETEGGVVLDFDDEEWDDVADDFVKVKDKMYSRFIGIRY